MNSKYNNLPAPTDMFDQILQTLREKDGRVQRQEVITRVCDLFNLSEEERNFANPKRKDKRPLIYGIIGEAGRILQQRGLLLKSEKAKEKGIDCKHGEWILISNGRPTDYKDMNYSAKPKNPADKSGV